MTDPEFADATYIEPITPEFIEKIIAKERPDAVLATLGGQTALNAAIGLQKAGTLERYGTRLIGADVDAIERGENREIFKSIVAKIGGESAKSIICHTMEEIIAGAAILNYPVVVRPSFTMVDLVQVSPSMKKIYVRSRELDCAIAQHLRFFSKNQFWVGKSMNLKLCGMPRITW